MDNIKIINHILNGYKQAIGEKIEDNNKGKQNKMRSSRFIELITKKIKAEFLINDEITVFSKEMVKNTDFKRNEFLFDIHICEVGEFTSIKNKTVKYIKKSLVEIESEFAKDTFKVAIDFSKLVCGNSKLKIMIISKCYDNDSFVEYLKNIARNIDEKIYLIVLTHPSQWDITTIQEYSILRFEANEWIDVNIV